jgi:riboflavin kinase / FMN adenylyltransferase
MTVYRSLQEVPPDFGPSALTIGNFDGVHLGHRQILRRLRALADANGWKASVVTFDPHPTRLVAPQRAPRLLTTPERRAELMREEGVDQVLILPFTRHVAQLSAEEFVSGLLVERLGARVVLVGDNFHFGRAQSGNVQSLEEWGPKYGFRTEIVRVVACRGHIVSSSGIRGLILTGRVSLAARHLQRPYGVEGQVVSGRGVGSRQTVPTLNLDTAAEVIPASGVYVTRTFDLAGGRQWNSVTNIGFRPTFGRSDQLSIETYLLDPLEGDTPPRIRVEFLLRLRSEKEFASAEDLKAQILLDVRAARSFFRRAKAWIGRPLAPA